MEVWTTHSEDVLMVPGVAEDDDQVRGSLRTQHRDTADVYGVTRVDQMQSGVRGSQLVRKGVRVTLWRHRATLVYLLLLQ